MNLKRKLVKQVLVVLFPNPFKSTLYHALRQYMGAETENDQTLNHNIDLSGRRILLAEDNELNWEVAKEFLSDLGVELDWAEDGQICLDKFKRSPEGYYDAILLWIYGCRI